MSCIYSETDPADWTNPIKTGWFLFSVHNVFYYYYFFGAASRREVHHGRPGSLLTQQGRVSASVRIWWSVDRPKSELMCPWSQLSLRCQRRQSPTTEPRQIGWLIKTHLMPCQFFFPFLLQGASQGEKKNPGQWGLDYSLIESTLCNQRVCKQEEASGSASGSFSCHHCWKRRLNFIWT